MIVWHLLRFWNGWFIIRIPLIQRRCVDTQFNTSTCRAQLRWMKRQVYPPLDQPSSILFTPYRAWVVGDFRLTMRRWKAAAGHASNADRLTAVPDVDPNEPRCPWPHLYPEIRGQSYYFAHGHRSCAAAVLCHRDLLRRLPCHRCDSWVTTNRLPLTPTAAGPGIFFGTSSTVSDYLVSGPIAADRKFNLRHGSHRCDCRHRLYRSGLSTDPIRPQPLSPPEPVGFRAEFQPSTVAIFTTDNPDTFNIVGDTYPACRRALRRCQLSEPAQASTTAGEPILGTILATSSHGSGCHHRWHDHHSATNLFQLSSCSTVPPSWSFSSGHFTGVQARPNHNLGRSRSWSWSDSFSNSSRTDWVRLEFNYLTSIFNHFFNRFEVCFLVSHESRHGY